MINLYEVTFVLWGDDPYHTVLVEGRSKDEAVYEAMSRVPHDIYDDVDWESDPTIHTVRLWHKT